MLRELPEYMRGFPAHAGMDPVKRTGSGFPERFPAHAGMDPPG